MLDRLVLVCHRKQFCSLDVTLEWTGGGIYWSICFAKSSIFRRSCRTASVCHDRMLWTTSKDARYALFERISHYRLRDL